MIDFDDITTVVNLLTEAQDADHDMRENAREADHFVNKKDGQWEPDILNRLKSARRPRYTFDQVGPVIDQIAGGMESSSFDIKTKPANGEADQETADTYDGIIRNIEANSNAVDIYNAASRSMITSGMDGWRVVQEFVDDDAFEQDLLVKPVFNAIDTMWLDPTAKEQSKKDAMWGFFLSPISVKEFEDKYPNVTPSSLQEDRRSEVYTFKPTDIIVIGEFWWKKEITRELVMMSNNAVYEVDDKFKKVEKELKQQGITETKRRKRKKHVVFSRLLSADDWLNEGSETVFDFIPLIPIYGNYKISEGKPIYSGAVEALMDAQRVYNYAKSRQIEEGALAPRQKVMMTREQMMGHTDTLQTMNTNADPVQGYEHVTGQPQPFPMMGPQINAGLQQTAADASVDIGKASGLFAPNLGDNPGLQSGVAIERLQDRGDNSTIKWFNARKIAIQHTACILVKAIPKVYDTTRQVRLINPDGTQEVKTVNDSVFDDESQKMVDLLDLSKGIYDVICEVGPAFSSRQGETIAALNELAAVNPAVMQMSTDIYLRNVNAPGMDDIADRARAQMLQAGIIPEDQLTDEEKQQIQAAQEAAAANPPQPDPALLIAQAEIGKAEAQAAQAQAKAADIQLEANSRETQARLELERIDLDREKLDLEKLKLEQKTGADETKTLLDAMKQQREDNLAIANELKIQAETLKTLREAQGVDVIVGPHTQEAFIQQAELVTESQDRISPTPETQEVTNQLTER